MKYCGNCDWLKDYGDYCCACHVCINPNVPKKEFFNELEGPVKEPRHYTDAIKICGHKYWEAKRFSFSDLFYPA